MNRSSALLRRFLPVISWVGLGLSLFALLASAPKLIKLGGGFGTVAGNVAQYGWTFVLLLLVFARTRTVGARALTGAALAGFFGVGSLAVLIGKPFVTLWGPRSYFVMCVFAPVTEELLKLMPVAIFLLLAARNRRWRPSVGDAVLMGFAIASGFTVYENILYARGTGGGWFANLPFSLLLPFITSAHGPLVGTHAVYTGVTSLGLAAAVIYGRRFRLARWALPASLAIVVLEHAVVNRTALIGMFGAVPWWVRLASVLTLHGYLSTLLLVGGVGAVAVLETRMVGRGGAALPAAVHLRDLIASLTRSPRFASIAQLFRRLSYESLRRSAILAVSQTNTIAPDIDAVAAIKQLQQKAGLPIGAAA